MRYTDTAEFNFHRFKTIDHESDFAKLQRTFSGKMTKGRWKKLHRLARRLTWRTHCGHEWDCCGCLFAQHAEFTYKQNQVTITITQHFNY